MCDFSGLFVSCVPHDSLPVHLLWDFFFFNFSCFMISIGKRLVTSTNLEYSFFLLLLFCFSTFLSLSKLMSALK